ncbi:hypothetical protein [Sphingomonas immobilis]|uniref:Lipoprotein n=1 Tax=Sphingomonas immobilis TaxID=3063997 RepID=A0ABT8ZVN3_9SPHN|nr:hypothetical protein [Sphingomonas sp. CA1-15]MDO7840816.1 hypothetical protein [Sphingomonas sp. CA1-15]
MTTRGLSILASMLLAAGLAGCATTPPAVLPPPVVATIAPPPPVIPYGGYVGMEIPKKRPDGTYPNPNLNMTDQAAVWHLRNALNVAALGCDKVGGGIAAPYNAWLAAHGPALEAYYKRYLAEWEITGWGDWQAAYDNNQTRIYNFYSQTTMREAFCTAARAEVSNVAVVADADLPVFARAALARLDKPFLDFYRDYDAWRDYYHPKPPPVVPTLPTTPAAPIAVATPSPEVAMSGAKPEAPEDPAQPAR